MTFIQWLKLCEILGGQMPKHENCKGVWGHAPQKIFKIWIPEMAFAAF
jgi:hypothetical protein